MPTALIASKSKETVNLISSLLLDCEFTDINSFTSAQEVREMLHSQQIDLSIICTPLDDEFGLELVSDIHEISDSAIIVITNSNSTDEIQKKISFANAFVLGRPLNKTVFMQCIKYVLLSREEIIKLRNQNADLQQKMQDLRLVDRAKCMLIQYLRITEAQAHRYIQKQAMDQRITQADVAKDILRTYEN